MVWGLGRSDLRVRFGDGCEGGGGYGKRGGGGVGFWGLWLGLVMVRVRLCGYGGWGGGRVMREGSEGMREEGEKDEKVE